MMLTTKRKKIVHCK